MVFDNRADDGLWYATYTGQSWQPGVIANTASSLEGPWSDEGILLNDSGNPESPFLLKRGEWYYLWQQSQVRASRAVTNFMSPMVTDMNFGYKWAPEIVELNGQEYIAAYGNGIYVSKFGWVTKEITDADIVLLSGDFDEPAFDSTNTVYLGAEPNWKTSVSYRFRPAQEGSTQTVTVSKVAGGSPSILLLGGQTNLAFSSLEKRSESGTPFYISLDILEPHLPNRVPEPYNSMYPPEEIEPWGSFSDNFEKKPYIQEQQLRTWKVQDYALKEWLEPTDGNMFGTLLLKTSFTIWKMINLNLTTLQLIKNILML